MLLFDTGFGFGNDELDAYYSIKARRVPDVLAESGIAIDDVTAVVNCHLHVDHAGQNSLFPGIPIHVQPMSRKKMPRITTMPPRVIPAPGP